MNGYLSASLNGRHCAAALAWWSHLQPPKQLVSGVGFASMWVLAVLSTLGGAIASAAEISRTTEVGPVKATVTLSPSEPVIGDEIELQIVVATVKDIEVLMPEFGEALERYSILDFVPQQQIDASGKTVLTQKYTLQPFLSGEQSIPPILIEFIDHRPGSQPSPDDFDAYELLTERIDFSVQSVVPDSASDELRPPLGELELPTTMSGRTKWFILAGVLLGVATIIAALLFASRLRTGILKRNAYEIAKQKLDRLLRDRNSDSPTLSIEQFYIEISALVRQYLENRFEVRAPELTTDEFLQLAAAESELSAEHQQLLGEFLSQADLVKFAGGFTAGGRVNDHDVQRTCALASRFLEETRENAPDVVIQPDDNSANESHEPATRPREESHRV